MKLALTPFVFIQRLNFQKLKLKMLMALARKSGLPLKCLHDAMESQHVPFSSSKFFSYSDAPVQWSAHLCAAVVTFPVAMCNRSSNSKLLPLETAQKIQESSTNRRAVGFQSLIPSCHIVLEVNIKGMQILMAKLSQQLLPHAPLFPLSEGSDNVDFHGKPEVHVRFKSFLATTSELDRYKAFQNPVQVLVQ